MPDDRAHNFFKKLEITKYLYEVMATIYTPLEGYKIYGSSRYLVLSGLLIFANLIGLE